MWLTLSSPFVFAQVHTAISETTGIGTLGTVVTPDGTTFKITGGTRSDEGRGTNLFHSFDQFNIGPGDVAKFLNATSAPHTENIVSRVTGQSPSSIFGTIDTTNYPGANLFLMNPAGIVFGPTAKLDVGGSVTFTTANYLRLAGADSASAGIFYADGARTNVLTSASIAAFGFLDPNPKAIGLQESVLNTNPGKSISLVGGDRGFSYANGLVPDGVVLTRGHLSTAGGGINIASVGSEGEILAGTLAQSPNINGQSFQSLGSVQLLQQSSIDARGDGDGTIRIQGGQLVIDNSTVSSHAGAVSLDASSVQIMGASQITTEATAISNAGHITVNATGPISLDSSLVASAAGSGSGRAGNILFTTTHGNVTLIGGSFITTQANSIGGGAGAIQIEAKQGAVRIESGSQILNFTEGGPLGSILIAAKNLYMSQAAILENNLSAQPAGNLVITLTGDLSVTSNSIIQTGTPARANAAGLVITARDILVADKSTLFSGTTGSGSGGPIDLSVRSLTIQHGGKISAETSGTASSATGGPIIINATDHVTLTNGGSITASSTGLADAGSIFVNAGQQLDLTNGSSITTTTQSAQANGGNIDIRAIERVRLVDSEISTSVMGTEGSGGNIFIDPNMVVLQGSTVTAQAVGGSGGNITFVTPLFLADSSSIISATSKFGPDGKVTARSNLIATIPQLESKATAPQVLLQNRCVALAGGEQSTFILAGRDTLPSQPGGWLSSPVAMEHWTGDKMEEHASGLMVRRLGPRESSPVMTQANGTEVLSLRRLTPSGFLVRSFADRALTGCRS
ncbi:MAG: filamentous hemagglutinin N-terminal domain-containing protein [Nitrospira sp.]|nr:filamentous hemagglutinin N-terminal domain-containing protein [Nitrospira sp.]